MLKYRPRIIDKQLERYLRITDVIIIVGPKWCGKTTTAKKYMGSFLKIETNKKDYYYLQMAKFNHSNLIDCEKPRLIDEWQISPNIWYIIQDNINNLDTKGKYILTESTIVDEKFIMHH